MNQGKSLGAVLRGTRLPWYFSQAVLEGKRSPSQRWKVAQVPFGLLWKARPLPRIRSNAGRRHAGPECAVRSSHGPRRQAVTTKNRKSMRRKETSSFRECAGRICLLSSSYGCRRQGCCPDRPRQTHLMQWFCFRTPHHVTKKARAGAFSKGGMFKPLQQTEAHRANMTNVIASHRSKWSTEVSAQRIERRPGEPSRCYSRSP